MLAVVGAAVFPALAESIDDRLYRCQAIDEVGLEDSGSLAPRTLYKAMFSDFVVDTKTGVLRFKAATQQWSIIQRGSDINDFVAAPNPGEVAAATDAIRVRAWPHKPKITFLAFNMSTLVSGTCEVIR